MDSLHREMITQATQAYRNAYAPYSNFPVGVCIRSEDDQLFSGCNAENAAYPVGTCAESNAIGAMIVSGQRRVKEVVIMTPNAKLLPPCGACRQQLYEFSSPETRVHLYNMNGDHKTLTVGELLPEPFGHHHLGQ